MVAEKAKNSIHKGWHRPPLFFHPAFKSHNKEDRNKEGRREELNTVRRRNTLDEERLICPYCGREQLTHEPDDISSTMCNTECEHCGRLFWYAVNVSRTYCPYKLDVDDTVREGGQKP